MRHINSIAALVLASCALAAHAGYVDPGVEVTQHKFEPQKVVYQVNSGDVAVQKAVLNNVLHHYEALDHRMTAVVVIHGGGMDALSKPDDDTKRMLDKVRAAGVQVEVCNNTLQSKDLDWRNLYNVKNSDIVRSGVAEVAAREQQGYLYVKP